MKKVLVLTVIAVLALGVMALAAGSDHGGPTCSTNGVTLTVDSVITIETGIEADAVSYDATFCGATGKVLAISGGSTGTISSITTEASEYALLAQVTVQSNYSDANLTITPTNVPDGLTLYYRSADSYSSGSYTWGSWSETNSWSSSTELNLYGGTNGAAYHGAVQIAGNVQAWAEAVKNNTITFTFDITPETNY